MNLATHDFCTFNAVFSKLRLGSVLILVALLLLGGQSVRADRVITNITADALEEALGTAPGSDDLNVITFAASGTITLTKQFVIRENTEINAGSNTVTIQGGSSTNDATRFFNVRTGITLRVMGLTFSNGRSTNGGAIYNRGTFIASNCTFSGNVAAGKDGVNGANGAGNDENGKNGSDGATGRGGAIFSSGRVTLERCTFENNRATGGNGGNGGNGTNAPPGEFEGGDGGRGGDGGSAQGGAVYSSGRNLTVTDCTFEDNRISAGNAGTGGTAGTGGIAGIEKGGGTGGNASGAAIFTSRRAAVQNSTFVGNTAQAGNSATAGTDDDGDGENGPDGGVAQGGAIANVGTNGIINCTFFRNIVTGGNAGAGGDGDLEGGDGGNGGNGIGGCVYNAGRMGVTNCTFFGGGAFGGTGATNGAGFIPGDPGRGGEGLGGNIATVAGRLLMVNSILSAHIGGGNGYGTGTDLGYNISSDNSIILPGPGSRIGIDPRLDPPLANHGGPTRTLALRESNPASPAIDAGHPNICPDTDQRGFPRSGRCDVGAFEVVSGVVEGQVLNENGSAFTNGATLFLEGDSTTTDAEGFYSFQGLSGGDYDLHATAPGFRFEPASTNVSIGAAGTAITVNFTAIPLLAVSGQVTVNGTNGLPNVRIVSGSLSTTTTNNGTYELVGVSSNATINIRPELDGFYFVPSSTNIIAASNRVVNFAAVPLLAISGIVDSNGVGLANVRVSAGTVSTLTTSTGYYRLTGFPTNVPVTVRAELTGFSFRPPSTNVLVTSDTTINFTADATVVLGGRITSDGVGLRNVSVTVGSVTVPTDDNGIYVASNVARNVELTVRPQAFGYSFSPPFTTLTPAADNTNINFIATGTFTLSGRVTLDGSAGVGVTVMAGGRSTNTDSSGNYIFTQLAPAVYTVRAVATNYAFSPPTRNVSVFNNVTGIDFAGFTAYDIFGSVIDGDTSLGLGGVSINATNQTAPTNRVVLSVGDGSFALTNMMPGNVTLTPSRAGFEFEPTNLSFQLTATTNLPVFTGYQLFSISGSITNGTNRITNVLVRAGSYTALSDSNGNYRFPAVRRATYDIIPTLEGYTFEPAQVRLTVENANISNIGFRANGIYTVRGRITKDGLPLVGTEVVAGNQRVLTGSDGRYEFRQLPPGTYVVRPTPGQHAFEPAEVQVTVGPDRDNVDFTASLAFSVSGRVTSGSAGVSGVTVSVAGRSNVTDLAGGYTIPHVPAGDHTVVPSLAGSEFDPPSRAVSVTTHLAGIDFRRVFTITGQVLEGIEGIVGATVTLSNQTAFRSISTTDNGFYSFALLDAGTYTVTPVVAGKTFLPASRVLTVGPSTNGIDFRTVYTISGRVLKGSSGLRQVIISLSIDPETNLVETATDVNGFYGFTNIQGGAYALTPMLSGNGFVPPATNFVLSNNMTINFEAYTLFNISGRIVTPGGTGIPGVTVSTGERSAVSDGLGNYTITGLASNTYDVAASLPCFTFAPAMRSVTLGPNAVSVNFTGTFQSFTVRGTVTDGVNPLAGVFIKVEDATAVSGTNKTTFSESNGVFVVSNVCPGEISVSATRSGFYFEPRQYETNLTSDIDVNFVGTRGLSISGRVLDASGNGVSGVRIRSDSGDDTTDAEGTYVIEDLAPGMYTLRPVQVGSGISPTNQPVTLGSVDVFGVNFQINPPRISIARTNGEVDISLLGFPNQPYTIEFSTNFVDWRFLFSTNAPATNMPGVFILRDSSVTNSPLRFYRAVNF